jgi:hypothetical protein
MKLILMIELPFCIAPTGLRAIFWAISPRRSAGLINRAPPARSKAEQHMSIIWIHAIVLISIGTAEVCFARICLPCGLSQRI